MLYLYLTSVKNCYNRLLECLILGPRGTWTLDFTYVGMACWFMVGGGEGFLTIGLIVSKCFSKSWS